MLEIATAQSAGSATVSEFCQGTHTDGQKVYIDFAFKSDVKVNALNVSLPDGSEALVPMKVEGGITWGSLETSGNGKYEIETFKGDTGQTSFGSRSVPGYAPFEFTGQPNVPCPTLPAGAIPAQAVKPDKAAPGVDGGPSPSGGGVLIGLIAGGLVGLVVIAGFVVVVVGKVRKPSDDRFKDLGESDDDADSQEPPLLKPPPLRLTEDDDDLPGLGDIPTISVPGAVEGSKPPDKGSAP